jgi:hypothetical protein
MNKLGIFERVFMGISFISATISFLENINNSYDKYLWQLCVMIWISVSYIKLRMIEKYEENNKK